MSTTSADPALTTDDRQNQTDRGELSIFLSTPAVADPRDTYRFALNSILTAEALGYSCQHRDRYREGRLVDCVRKLCQPFRAGGGRYRQACG